MNGLSGFLQGLTGHSTTLPNQTSGQQQAPHIMGGFNLGGLMSMFGNMDMSIGRQPANSSSNQSSNNRTNQQPQNDQLNQQQSNQQVFNQNSQQHQSHTHGPNCSHNHQSSQQAQSSTQQTTQTLQQPSQQFPQLNLGSLV